MDGTHGARAANAVPRCSCLQCSPCSTRDDSDAANKMVHGLPVQSRDAAAYRAVPAARAMILAHMAMNGGKCNKGSRHGVMAKAGRQGLARQDKAVVAKRAGGEADRHRPCRKTAGR